jgi:hypothetical protein
MWYLVYTDMKIYILGCWNITPCNVVRGYRHFERSFYREGGIPWKHQ